jgi:hypothetical protein
MLLSTNNFGFQDICKIDFFPSTDIDEMGEGARVDLEVAISSLSKEIFMVKQGRCNCLFLCGVFMSIHVCVITIYLCVSTLYECVYIGCIY